MRNYDNPHRISLHFEQVDFGGAADDVRVIALPTDARSSADAGRFRGGRVYGSLIHNVTEDITGDVTDAGVMVGTAANTDLYYHSGLVLDESVDVGESVWLPDDGDAIDIPESAAGFITVTFIAATTTETGIADVELFIDMI